MIFLTVLVSLLNLTPLDSTSFPSKHVEKVSGTLTQGGFVSMQVKPNVSVSLNGKKLQQDRGLVVFGFGRDAKLVGHIQYLYKGKIEKYPYHLSKEKYDIQYIEGVEKKYVFPPEDVMSRIRDESRMKSFARSKTIPKAQFRDGFIQPAHGVITGVYGSQRFFNGQARRPHYGLDIAIPEGGEVKTMSAGKIVLAQKDMYYEGGLIFIDHGLGLMSAYLHLSDIDVEEGDMVLAGEVIGKVGSTGRSTGAHLDWRVYWYKERLNPILFVK